MHGSPLSHNHTGEVVDFGLAKSLAGDGPDATVTRSDQVMGTPVYMAPEAISGQRTVLMAKEPSMRPTDAAAVPERSKVDFVRPRD